MNSNMFDFMVWRHSCLSLSRTTGKFKLVENGKVAADEYSSDIINFMKKIPVEVYNCASSFIAYQLLSSFLQYLAVYNFQASIMTLGCYYRDVGVKFMSMYGSVTDAQVFSRELSNQDMVDITSCRSEKRL